MANLDLPRLRRDELTDEATAPPLGHRLDLDGELGELGGERQEASSIACGRAPHARKRLVFEQ